MKLPKNKLSHYVIKILVCFNKYMYKFRIFHSVLFYKLLNHLFIYININILINILNKYIYIYFNTIQKLLHRRFFSYHCATL